MKSLPTMILRGASLVLFAGIGGLTPACALLSKSDPIVPRYFSLETASVPAEQSPGQTARQPVAPGGLELQLGAVNSDSYIKYKIVRRDSDFELTYYEGRLWTEKPETYVRRALSHALFDERGVRQVLSGMATTLDVDVVAFEEVMKPEHVGRVELAYTLYDDRVVLQSRSVTVERKIEAKGESDSDAIVRALADALSAAVATVADATTGELRSEAASSKTAPTPAPTSSH